jgi:hypothetical protein
MLLVGALGACERSPQHPQKEGLHAHPPLADDFEVLAILSITPFPRLGTGERYA